MLRKGRSVFVPASMLLLAGVLAVLIGILLSVQAFIPLAALSVPLVLLIVLAAAVETVIWGLFVAALLLGGILSYFAGVAQAQWLPIGVGALLYLAVLTRIIGMRTGTVPRWPLLLLLGAMFVAAAVVSSAMAGVDVWHWIYGLRYLFPMGSILFALAFMPLQPELLRRLWIFIFAVALLQLPVAVYQYVVVAGRRIDTGAGGLAYDAVVGTMGGSQEGGGHSAAMGFFVVAAFVLAFSMWKRGLLSPWRTLLITAVALSVIFVAEVKAMVLIMPLAVLLLLRAQVLRHIKQVMAGVLVVMLLILAMPTLYSKLHYERAGRPPMGTVEFYERIIANTTPDQLNEKTQQLGRVAQLAFWWNQHDLLREPKEFLIGHGIGTTNTARIYSGDLVKRYFPLSVTNTAGGILLWEVGVVGFVLAASGVLWAALRSFGLSRNENVPPFHRAALEAGAVILVVLLPALFYKHFALKSPGFQAVLFLTAGQVCYWMAQLARTAGDRVAPTIRSPSVSFGSRAYAARP